MALRVRALKPWISSTGAMSEVRDLDCFHLPVRLWRDLLLLGEDEDISFSFSLVFLVVVVVVVYLLEGPNEEGLFLYCSML